MESAVGLSAGLVKDFAKPAMESLGAVGAITNLALTIWQKAEQAKQFKKDCRALANRAARIHKAVKDLRPKLRHPRVQETLLEIVASLEEANKLVHKCSKMSKWTAFVWSGTLQHEFEMVSSSLSQELAFIPLIQLDVNEDNTQKVVQAQHQVLQALAAMRLQQAKPVEEECHKEVAQMAGRLKRVATLRNPENSADIQAAIKDVMGSEPPALEKVPNRELEDRLVQVEEKMKQKELAFKQQLHEREDRYTKRFMEFIKQLECPISHKVMMDPVVLHETGQIYDRKPLEAWLKTNKTCPLTRKELKTAEFSPVYQLKNYFDVLVQDAFPPESHQVSGQGGTKTGDSNIPLPSESPLSDVLSGGYYQPSYPTDPLCPTPRSSVYRSLDSFPQAPSMAHCSTQRSQSSSAPGLNTQELDDWVPHALRASTACGATTIQNAPQATRTHSQGCASALYALRASAAPDATITQEAPQAMHAHWRASSLHSDLDLDVEDLDSFAESVLPVPTPRGKGSVSKSAEHATSGTNGKFMGLPDSVSRSAEHATCVNGGKCMGAPDSATRSAGQATCVEDWGLLGLADRVSRTAEHATCVSGGKSMGLRESVSRGAQHTTCVEDWDFLGLDDNGSRSARHTIPGMERNRAGFFDEGSRSSSGFNATYTAPPASASLYRSPPVFRASSTLSEAHVTPPSVVTHPPRSASLPAELMGASRQSENRGSFSYQLAPNCSLITDPLGL